MGEQRNLTRENVDELRERLEKMQEGNPDLEYRFFSQAEKESKPEWKSGHTELIKGLLDKIESLERKIDHIFGDHVLIKGQFHDISDMEDTKNG